VFLSFAPRVWPAARCRGSLRPWPRAARSSCRCGRAPDVRAHARARPRRPPLLRGGTTALGVAVAVRRRSRIPACSHKGPCSPSSPQG